MALDMLNNDIYVRCCVCNERIMEERINVCGICHNYTCRNHNDVLGSMDVCDSCLAAADCPIDSPLRSSNSL